MPEAKKIIEKWEETLECLSLDIKEKNRLIEEIKSNFISRKKVEDALKGFKEQIEGYGMTDYKDLDDSIKENLFEYIDELRKSLGLEEKHD